MNGINREKTSSHILVTIAACVVVIAGMKAAKTLLVPFLLSIFIAVICSPLLFWLRRKKIPMAIALIIVIMGILGVGLMVGVLVSSSLNEFTQALPLYQEGLQKEIAGISAFLDKMGVENSDEMLMKYANPGAAMKLALTMLAGLGNVLSNAFLIFLTVMFILLEAASFPAKLYAAFGSSKMPMKNFDIFAANISRYMAIKTWVSLVTGTLITVWLAVLGVDYAILWGLLAFMFNYVPNIGSIIAAVPAILLAYIQIDMTTAMLVAGGYIAVNMVIGNFIEPRFMGRGLGLSTLIVFLSLIFWGWVLGPVGMVLSIPLTMTLKIALSSREETVWISTLLGADSLQQPTG